MPNDEDTQGKPARAGFAGMQIEVMGNVKNLLVNAHGAGFLSESAVEEQFAWFYARVFGPLATTTCEECTSAFAPEDVRYLVDPPKFLCPDCATVNKLDD